ncbi:uncharacterized protein LOC106779879 [Vigna radiata var. radiata]|uniref:Uncharacterized protein LOC106779879 n=1 Tax=Vigna radiata var. radiata TaxID=3916 RepID=A0A1S3VZD5_VIGRR|nr:uncharacterized protein LOC106779879 [Vigna radiata var. radiata]
MDSKDQSDNPANDTTSPFYLHPEENPGSTLISQVLNETNYSSWSRNMRRALLSKNKIKFIDGSIKKPKKTETLFDTWQRCNMMVLSWIIKTLSPQIAESVIYVEEAKELWDELKERFSKGDYFKISDLLQDIHSIKQGERSVNQFFTDLKILWEELESLRPIPNCTCKIPCSCELSKISLKYTDIEHVICFLKGLNDNYNTVRTQILLMEPLPSINHVFSLIMQQERQERPGTNQFAETTKILANVTNRNNSWKGDQPWKNQGRGSGPYGQGRGRGRNPNHGKQCSYCNKMNHTVDECYSKHGYPPWYKKTDNNQEKKGGWNSANIYQSAPGPETFQTGSTSTTFNSLTSEQIGKLLRMIEKADDSTHKINQMHTNEKEDKPGTLSWIIDTGATDHVTYNKGNYITFYKIKPITVRLPNNIVITAEHAGTVQFSKDFVIFNVLYIPNFSFNLISVQSLIKDLDCRLTFSSKGCQIRKNSTLKMIGSANSHKGLYYLQAFSNPDQDFALKTVFSFEHTPAKEFPLCSRALHLGLPPIRRMRQSKLQPFGGSDYGYEEEKKVCLAGDSQVALRLTSQATGLARSVASRLVRGREREKILCSAVIRVAPAADGGDETEEGGGAVVGFEEVVVRLRNSRLMEGEKERGLTVMASGDDVRRFDGGLRWPVGWGLVVVVIDVSGEGDPGLRCQLHRMGAI